MEMFIFGAIVGVLVGLAFGGAVGIRMKSKEKPSDFELFRKDLYEQHKGDDITLREWWGS